MSQRAADFHENFAWLMRENYPGDSSALKLKGLYGVWRSIEASIAESDSAEKRDQFVDAQSTIISLMASIRCKSLEDVMFKLAIWRRECIEESTEAVGRGDKIALSALRDLVEIHGADALEKD